MKILLFNFLLLFSLQGISQFTININVKDNATRPAKKMFIAGNFNGWNSGDKKYELIYKNGVWSTDLANMDKGNYSFKFTQGSWETVEDSTNGVNISNREISIFSDTSFLFTSYGWHFEIKKDKPHTASKNVHILSDSFFIPQLKRKRKIWIYLPENYYSTTQKYPVLYMHDAQNLFDDNTALFGEWNVDECLDKLQKKLNKYAIVVGVDNGNEKRLQEYNPYDTKEYGKGEGDAYTSFIVNTLKPFIDKKYRTKSNATNTAIAGSSLGALISTYALLKYPTVFGSVGAFSPAYWIAPAIEDLAKKQQGKIKDNQFWFYGGGQEGYSMMKDLIRFRSIVSPKEKTTLVVDENGKHNEDAWRKQFSYFYMWWIKSIL
jgi:predicted alpha/beta superfamily hydrolase